MTQIGEGIAVAITRLQEGKCVFCGKAEHEFPKKDEIKPTNWKRETISGVGENFVSQKNRSIQAIRHLHRHIGPKVTIAWHSVRSLLMRGILQQGDGVRYHIRALYLEPS